MAEKKFRVWRNSNFGKPAFNVDVKDEEEAMAILQILTNYDLYLGDKIAVNAGGLEVYVGTDVDYETNAGWEEWNDKDTGNDIMKVMEERLK